MGSVALVSGTTALAQDEPFREIVNITGGSLSGHEQRPSQRVSGDRRRNHSHRSHKHGLRDMGSGAELDERFGVPVRYVLYSHYHDDHASRWSRLR